MHKIISLTNAPFILLFLSLVSGCSPNGRLGGESLEVSTVSPHPAFAPRIDPDLKDPAPAGRAARQGLVASLDVNTEGSGPKLAENDLALMSVSWTQGPRSGSQWVTLQQGGRPVERPCDAEKLPTKSCSKILSQEPIHLLDAALRQAFDARRLGSEIELSFNRGQAQAWESWAAEDGPEAGWKSAHHKGIDPRAVAIDTVVVRAQLVAACFPKVDLVGTRYKWSTPNAAPRNTIVMSSCQNILDIPRPQ